MIQRNSNIELLRMVSMFMIILHHYCNAIAPYLNIENDTFNTLIVQFFTIGGKIGVDVFFLISGYFMIQSKMKLKKFFHVVRMCVFYNLMVCVFMYVLGYSYPVKYFFYMIPFLFDLNTSFVANYLLIYLITPVLNAGLNNITRKQYHILLGVLIYIFTIQESILFQNSWQYFGWGITCYCIGAYIRRYNIDKFGRINYGVYYLFSYLIVFALILCVDFIPLFKKIFSNWGFWVTNAHKLSIIVPSILLFMSFLKMNVNYKSWINMFASATLGVLLLHANNAIQRDWLWYELIEVKKYVGSNYLVLHMFLSSVLVYLICVLIDVIRQKTIKFI